MGRAISGIGLIVGLSVISLFLIEGLIFAWMATAYCIFIAVLVFALVQGKYRTVENLSNIGTILILGILMFSGAQRY